MRSKAKEISDLIYTRILEPCSKRSSYKAASEFLEKPSYELHDVYRALDVLSAECDLIQSEIYKNSHFLGKRNDKILYYDCLNYYFEMEMEFLLLSHSFPEMLMNRHP